MIPDSFSPEYYLDMGVGYMEGYFPPSARVRNFSKAEQIFSDCVRVRRQKDYITDEHALTIEVEARFRLAQLFHYRKDLQNAVHWDSLAMSHLNDLPAGSDTTKYQCLLIHSIVLSAAGCKEDEYSVLCKLWESVSGGENLKLEADVANRIARSFIHSKNYREASVWILRAEASLFKAGKEASVCHALSSVQSRAAVILFERSRELWSEAEEALRLGVLPIHDPFLQRTRLVNMLKQRMKSLQVVRACQLLPTIFLTHLQCKVM